MGLAAVSEGILSGTPIATPQGWRAVEDLSPGDMVLTFDAAAQRLREVAHLPLPLDAGQWPRAHWPLRVPVGALGNRVELQLLPEQRVLIEADAAEHFFGDPFAVIPAAALLGFRGIDLCRPESGAVIVRLGMPGDQVIYAGRGALLACPDPELTLRRNDAAMQAGTAALGMAEARALVCYLQAAEGGAAFIRDPEMARQAAFF